MKTPADEPFHDAVRRADAGRLSRLLDARDCPPAVLRRLIRHEDPTLRHLGLVLLTERVTAGPLSDNGERAELAGLLPVSLTGPPEADLLLAGLYERLAPHLRGRPRPPWRTAGLPVRVAIAWLRAELLDEPVVIRDEAPGELLYQAVRQTDITGAHSPSRLVSELADSGDPVLQAEALRLARQGLHAGLLAPALVREILIGLLGADDDRVVVGALGELAEPWAAMEPLRPGCISTFLTAGPAGRGLRWPTPPLRPPPATATRPCCGRSSTIRIFRRAFAAGEWNCSAIWRTAPTSVTSRPSLHAIRCCSAGRR